MSTDWTAGVVRHGVVDPVPPPYRYRSAPERCGTYGHPGVTYHPQHDRTWCLCGAVTHPGNWIDWAFAHPASPLRNWWDDDARNQTITAWATDGSPAPTYHPVLLEGDPQ